jgi:hypothetical protein
MPFPTHVSVDTPSVRALVCAGLAFALGLMGATPARAQFPCEPTHMQVIVPGYVSVPADVRVICTGNGARVEIQWPFDDPSPEAWLNVYEYDAEQASVSMTLGGEWLCTIRFIPNDGGQTRYLFAGCPEEYGGNGTPVPWNDPCVQKVRARIYPDFWIMKKVLLQGGGSGTRAIAESMRQIVAPDQSLPAGDEPVLSDASLEWRGIEGPTGRGPSGPRKDVREMPLRMPRGQGNAPPPFPPDLLPPDITAPR